MRAAVLTEAGWHAEATASMEGSLSPDAYSDDRFLSATYRVLTSAGCVAEEGA